MNREEPILHLANRARKGPETLRASETKRMAEWIVAAHKQQERDSGRLRYLEDLFDKSRVLTPWKE